MQAHWRGYWVRKTRTSPREVAVRGRVRKANDRARRNPHLTLGNRARSALQVLLTSKTVSELLKACEALDVATQFSMVCMPGPSLDLGGSGGRFCSMRVQPAVRWQGLLDCVGGSVRDPYVN